MSVRCLSRVWEHSRHSGTALLMMLAIADFADDDGRAYPSIATLAKKCRMSPRNVNLILAELRKSGELTVRQNEGPNATNLYVVRVQPLKQPSPPEELFTLKDSSPPPEAGFLTPLKPASDKPSVNRQRTVSREKRTRSPEGSRLSAEWILPDEYQQWAMQERGWTPTNCQAVGAAFRDHWIAQPGSRGRKADWFATWRNWVRRENSAKPTRTPRPENFSTRNYREGINDDGTF